MSRALSEHLAMIGAVLKAARIAAGLSQADVARAVGIPRTKFPLIERGEYRPGAEKLLLLIAFLGLTIEDLVPQHAETTPVAS